MAGETYSFVLRSEVGFPRNARAGNAFSLSTAPNGLRLCLSREQRNMATPSHKGGPDL